MADRAARMTFTATPLLVDDAGAARLLGIGLSYFRVLLKSGKIGPVPVRLGRRQLHRVDLLREFIEAGLPDREKWLQMQEADV